MIITGIRKKSELQARLDAIEAISRGESVVFNCRIYGSISGENLHVVGCILEKNATTRSENKDGSGVSLS